jgi:hypothetical protein
MSDSEQTSMTRRQLLATVAKVGVSAPLAAAAGALDDQAPRPPSNVRVLDVSPVPPSGKRVLTLADLSFAGYIRFPADFDDLWYAYGQLAMRRVGGQLRVFTAGDITNDFPILEYAMPDKPGMDVATAPKATAVRNWGAIPLAQRITGGTMGSVVGGFYWDETRNALWWSYGDIYAPVDHHPSIGCAILNDSNGTKAFYGPWRTEWHSQKTRGCFVPIPQSFADAYMDGKSLGVMAHSHNAESPWGAILSGMVLPDPRTTDPDVAFSKHFTLASHGLILHDINHRQARDTRYKFCNWKQRYDCRAGSTIDRGVPLFGGPVPGSSGEDTMSSAVWIDLPDKHGVLYFGSLASTPEGYVAPGDPDGLAHQWYGSAFDTTNPKGLERNCCHNQDDPWWDATGPGAHYRLAKGWIYNPNDLVATAEKKADLWSRTPASEFEWGSKLPPAAQRTPPGFFRNAIFDAPAKRIYVVLNAIDTVTAPGKPRGAIAVFDVR